MGSKSKKETIVVCNAAAEIASIRGWHGVADRFRAAAEAGSAGAASCASPWVLSAWCDASANDALGAANAAYRDECEGLEWADSQN